MLESESTVPSAPVAPSSAPLRALPYEEESAPNALLAIVRTVGLLAVIMAPTRMVLLALGWWVQARLGSYYGPVWTWTLLILTPMELVLSVVQLIGGIGCLRRRIRGRGLLIGSAWASLGLILAQIAMGLIVSLQRAPRSVLGNAATPAYYTASYIHREIGPALLPLVTLVLLTRRPVAALFTRR